MEFREDKNGERSIDSEILKIIDNAKEEVKTMIDYEEQN